jgi:hypothetical protein
MHVALDPENFSRFNEGIIQAALLRSALPSELDYRSDTRASGYMAVILSRIASKFDSPQVATLEFIIALATKRMQLTENDTAFVRDLFKNAAESRRNKISGAVLLILKSLDSKDISRRAF